MIATVVLSKTDVPEMLTIGSYQDCRICMYEKSFLHELGLMKRSLSFRVDDFHVSKSSSGYRALVGVGSFD